MVVFVSSWAMIVQDMLADFDEIIFLSIKVILISGFAKAVLFFHRKNSVILLCKNILVFILLIFHDFVHLKLDKELEILLRYCGCSTKCHCLSDE